MPDLPAESAIPHAQSAQGSQKVFQNYNRKIHKFKKFASKQLMSELSTPLCWSQRRFRYPRFRFQCDSDESRQLLPLVWLPLQFQEQQRIRAPLRGMGSWSFSWEFLLMGWWVHTLYWDHDSSWQSKPPQIDGCFNLVLNFASPIWFLIEEPGSLSRWWPAPEPIFCLLDCLCFRYFLALFSPSRLRHAQTATNWPQPEGASGLNR